VLECIEALSKGLDRPMMLTRNPTLGTAHQFSDLSGPHLKDVKQFKDHPLLHRKSKRQFSNHSVQTLLINLLAQTPPMILHKGITGSLFFLNPLKGIGFGRRLQ